MENKKEIRFFSQDLQTRSEEEGKMFKIEFQQLGQSLDPLIFKIQFLLQQGIAHAGQYSAENRGENKGQQSCFPCAFPQDGLADGLRAAQPEQGENDYGA